MSYRRIILRDIIIPKRIIKYLKPFSPGNPEITLRRFWEWLIIITEKKAILPGDIVRVPGKPKPLKGRLKKAWRNFTGKPPRYNQLRPNIGNYPSLPEPPWISPSTCTPIL